ncbi:CDP-glycerol glycerophosphotransferase family protein [Candidatus Woesearchaeota archaeon]|nr:CDP-glycerol glycerophosphotransferase family protein [Candidatus Woesearchaeota archaeon]
MKKKVLAASWHPGGINSIIPVIKRLSEEKKAEVVTIGHQYSEKILDAANMDYLTVHDYGLADASYGSMEKVLSQEAPDLVLTGTSSQDDSNRDVLEQTLTLAAREKPIPSLAVFDFWANYSMRFDDIYTGEKFKFLPDRIAIMDQYAEKAMLDEGFEKERLVITGNPHFDDLEAKAKSFSERDKQDINERIGLKSKLMVFYAANAWKKDKAGCGYWDLDNIILIDETISGLPGNQKQKAGLVIKLHPRTPGGDVEEIRDYLKSSQSNPSIVADIGTQQLVLASDLTLTSNSTVGIEAVYMGKPCISIQPGLKGKDFLSILTKNNIIPFGYTGQDCRSLIREAIVNDTYRNKELIEKASGFRTDGKATERVTQLVYQMLSC